MSIKRDVLYILEQNRERSVSGEEMAGTLHVSRSAVWKAIHALKKDGYGIQASTNKGYRLSEGTDLLSAEGILPYLKECLKGLDIRIYRSLNSTNQEAKRLALKENAGDEKNVVVLAENQTMGKGRMGRGFYSPEKSGLYMSVLLHPKLEATNAVLITTAAAVAVCRAIRRLTEKEPEIKWVNDVFLNGKKLCGILTEAVTNFETGEIENVVLGVGVNVWEPDELPDELRDVVGWLFAKGESPLTRNQLAAEILNQFFDLYQTLPEREFILDYKKWSMVLGKKIRFMERGEWIAATALDIESDGGLKVKMQDGGIRSLRTGEISLRLIKEEAFE